MHTLQSPSAACFSVPAALEARVDELVAHYPQRRSASLMVLHALQDHFGFISSAAIEWTAAKLALQPINIYELVTFYPMFRTAPAGRFQLKVCRTLSCALAGADKLHRYLCERLGLDPARGGLQTSTDGRFSVEFVECLASCDKAPVMMCNETFHEGVSPAQADQLLNDLNSGPGT